MLNPLFELRACFFSRFRHPKEVCSIPECSNLDLWLHVVVPAAVAAAVLAAVLLLACCLRRRCCGWGKKRPLPNGHSASQMRHDGSGFSNGGLHHGSGSGTHLISAAASSIMGGGAVSSGGSPRSVAARTHASSSVHNYSEMEMNSLLPPPQLMQQQQQPPPQVSSIYNQPQQQPLPPPPFGMKQQQQQQQRAREFPITSVRFNQEMGEGSYGKVYRGDLVRRKREKLSSTLLFKN